MKAKMVNRLVKQFRRRYKKFYEETELGSMAGSAAEIGIAEERFEEWFRGMLEEVWESGAVHGQDDGGRPL